MALKYLSMIPLFALLLIIYIILAGLGVDFSDQAAGLFSMSLFSGATWTPTMGDFFVIFGIVLLYIELLKATKTGTATIIEHVSSMFTFILYLVLFLLWSKAGTSAFFILSMMSLLDVIAGFTVTIVAARRDIGLGGGG